MQPEKILLINRSFVRLIPYSEVAVRVFWERLLLIDPSLKGSLESSLGRERDQLAKALALMIESLRDPRRLRRYSQFLGYRYGRNGIGPESYVSIQDAMLWTLQHLVPDVSEATMDAWREGLALCATHMEEGHNELVVGLR